MPNIFPEKVIKTTGADTSNPTSYVFTFDAWSNISLFSFVCILISIACLAPFLSVVFLILYFNYIEDRPIKNSYNFFGALSSIYLFFDFYKDWFLSSIIKTLGETEDIKQILSFNLAILIMHLILLFFGVNICKAVSNKQTPAIVIILIILAGLYFISKALFVNQLIKLI